MSTYPCLDIIFICQKSSKLITYMIQKHNILTIVWANNPSRCFSWYMECIPKHMRGRQSFTLKNWQAHSHLLATIQFNLHDFGEKENQSTQKRPTCSTGGTFKPFEHSTFLLFVDSVYHFVLCAGPISLESTLFTLWISFSYKLEHT